jgi:hypothetical protein
MTGTGNPSVLLSTSDQAKVEGIHLPENFIEVLMGVRIFLHLDDYEVNFVGVEVSSSPFKKCEWEVSYGYEASSTLHLVMVPTVRLRNPPEGDRLKKDSVPKISNEKTNLQSGFIGFVKTSLENSSSKRGLPIPAAILVDRVQLTFMCQIRPLSTGTLNSWDQ